MARFPLPAAAILLIAAVFAACSGDAPASLHAAPIGQYRAVLTVAGGDLPFGLELASEQGRLVAYLENGPERVRAPDLQWLDGQLTIRMPGYSHRLEARLVDGRLEGQVTFLRPRGVMRSVRLVAMPGQPFRFFPEPPAAPRDFSGRWALVFRDASGKEGRAIAELTQNGHQVQGTVLRATGDDRYIAGEARGDTLFLSRFDGGSAYLYLGRLAADGTLSGEFHTGGGAFETWSGRRDAAARLEDPTRMAGLKPGIDTLEFAFPDLDGTVQRFPAPRHAGKVVIVTIGGSWCPNCHDEAVFLRELLATRRERGLEVVQLMFEYTPEFASAAAAARGFAEKFAIDYPVLIAGVTHDGDVLKKLPQLAGFQAYPTTLVIDRRGKVRRVHTGFSGPATGQHYVKQNQEMTELIDHLLAETG
ncbi:MAG: TlpA family protein disulfide reductase [Gammaproteobacteria bacterium]|nr:MAG: TlpA family protein disulfide reductase [Gammaproteobacteria bacterium]